MFLRRSRKWEWPECKGKRADETVEKIKQERPDLVIHTIPSGSIITMDFRNDRVRIIVDDNDVVVDVPKVG